MYKGPLQFIKPFFPPSSSPILSFFLQYRFSPLLAIPHLAFLSSLFLALSSPFLHYPSSPVLPTPYLAFLSSFFLTLSTALFTVFLLPSFYFSISSLPFLPFPHTYSCSFYTIPPPLFLLLHIQPFFPPSSSPLSPALFTISPFSSSFPLYRSFFQLLPSPLFITSCRFLRSFTFRFFRFFLVLCFPLPWQFCKVHTSLFLICGPPRAQFYFLHGYEWMAREKGGGGKRGGGKSMNE